VSDSLKAFYDDRKNSLASLEQDALLRKTGQDFVERSIPHKYTFNFDWMGRPIIQHAEDILAMQEIIFRMQPDLIVETGVAHGGSSVFYASMCRLMGKGHVVGIDIDIRPHNRLALEEHPMYEHITLIEGSSTDLSVVNQVTAMAKDKRVLVILDSNHTHDHVLQELRLYSPLTHKDDYLVVFDTIVENLPDALVNDRPWGKGDNPMTAVKQFLKENGRFEVDREMEGKLIISMAPHGYLRCLKD